jgi:hypothetical protein
MSLVDAVRKAGTRPGLVASQAAKRRYSELLSAALAEEVSSGLRATGFPNVKPLRGGPGERAFQGGLGPKKVDVSYADERHGLLLAVSIKTICFPPYGKNLKNRFGDLCTEAINLHMRFPYSIMTALFAMPEEADEDVTPQRRISTMERARLLFGTISGREDYSSPGEKFEDVVMMRFRPATIENPEPVVNLYLATTRPGQRPELSEEQYFSRLRDIYNIRNPHAQIGIEPLDEEDA